MNTELAEHRPSETQTTALTVAERAALAVGTSQHEAKLIQLAADAKTITAITNADGYKEAHSTRMTLKNKRLLITKTSKDARDDATAFAKGVIAEEKRLIAIISPEEERLENLQKDWDDAIEAEKQRKIDEENARIQRIKDSIAAIQRYPVDAVNKPSSVVKQFIESCNELVIDEATYAEHTAYAAIVKADTLTALAGLLQSSLAAEAEQERIQREREELEMLREKQRKEEQARIEQERVQKELEAASLRAEREALRKKELEAQEELRKQREESERLTRELAALRKANDDRVAAENRAAQEKRLAEELAEQERINEENARIEAERIEQELAAMDKANAEASIAAQAESEDRIQHPALSAPSDPFEVIEVADRPTDEEIISAVAEYFDVSTALAFEWIKGVEEFQPQAELLAA